MPARSPFETAGLSPWWPSDVAPPEDLPWYLRGPSDPNEPVFPPASTSALAGTLGSGSIAGLGVPLGWDPFNPPVPTRSAVEMGLVPFSAAHLGRFAWAPPRFGPVDPSPSLSNSQAPGLPLAPVFFPENPDSSSGLGGDPARLGSFDPGPPYGRWGGPVEVATASANAGSGADALAFQLGRTNPTPGLFSSPASTWPGPPPLTESGPTPSYSAGEIVGDAAKSFGVGVGRVALNSLGAFGDLREKLASGVQKVADRIAPGHAPNAGSVLSESLKQNPLFSGPTSAELQHSIEQYTGPFYQPKTIYGDYAETAGEFVPGVIANPEGSLGLNALRYGLLPAFSSETAGQLTKGTAAEPWARTAAALAAAGPSALRDLFWTRSAPQAAEKLAPPQLSPAEQLAARRRAQLAVNTAAGKGFEETSAGKLSERGSKYAPQVTVKTPSELKTRLDFVARDPETSEIMCIECKASETAPVKERQARAHEAIEREGATIVGKGKPGFPGGMKIPPTKVKIWRPDR